MVIGGAAVIGMLEAKAKSEADFILNKLPRPIEQLGYTGGTALALYIAGKLTGNRWLKLGAKSAAVIAAYQIAQKGKDIGKGVLSLSGWDDEDGHEHMLPMGALSAEGDAMSGLPFDDRVDDPMT